MAQTSRAVRKLRRLKRERTLLYRAVDLLQSQRDQARITANAAIKELEAKERKPEAEVKIIPDEQSNQVN